MGDPFERQHMVYAGADGHLWVYCYADEDLPQLLDLLSRSVLDKQCPLTRECYAEIIGKLADTHGRRRIPGI